MGIVTRLAQGAVAPSRTRMYAGAKFDRLTTNWVANAGSGDSELWSSLHQLRNRSRQLIRDNSYAKRAKLIVVNNIIGSGIAMEPKVLGPDGKLDEKVNDAIEAAWAIWSRAENCHTGGKLSFSDLERQSMGQIFEAGEVLERKYFQSFGQSKIPFALELIEGERLADDISPPVGALQATYRMGVERDTFGRPVAYWLRKYHPGELRYAGSGEDPNFLFRVPAAQIYHLYAVDRWPQTRGEPWLHSAMRRLNDMDGYSEAEIVRARGAASYMGFIETPDEAGLPNDNPDPNGQPQFDLEPGAVQRLRPGETFNFANPSSPSANADPFMRLMLREVAAGVGPSYESLSRDYSQSNYSSSRLALLDDRDLWRVLQQFFIRSFREPLHREWLQQAVLARAIPQIDIGLYAADPQRFEAVAFKPRGWSWINPQTEVQAYKEAVRNGFMSNSMVVALTGYGVDLEDVRDELQAEIEDAKARGLVFDTDTSLVDAKGAAQGIKGGVAPDWYATSVPTAAPGVKPTSAPESDPAATQPSDQSDSSDDSDAVDAADDGMRALVASNRELIAAVLDRPAAIVNISPQPVNVDVAAPQITVAAPERADAAGSGEQTIEVTERDDNGFARTIRKRDASFEIVDRDEDGNIVTVRRRSAA